MDIRNILLHLSLIEKVGPATIDKLVTVFSSFKDNDLLLNVYGLSLKELIYYSGLRENIATLIYNGLKDKILLNKELELLNKYAIKFITVFDQDYPSLLKEIYLPPTILYIKASDEFKFNNNAIAVVGSRKCDNYGLKAVKSIVPGLVDNKYHIISGGAYGIDTMAHKTCLSSSGITICVLGSGLLNLYPKENKGLFEQIILNNGALISPFSLNTTAHPGNFPARNRIISGLSLACLVIQAQEKSGALITANYALDQGREVLAVPGPIDSSLSQGCHKLISQGAQLTSSANDILHLFGQSTAINQNKVIENCYSANSIIENNLSDAEKEILKLLQEPLSFDELFTGTNLNFEQLQDILFNMQIKGYINQNILGFWQRA